MEINMDNNNTVHKTTDVKQFLNNSIVCMPIEEVSEHLGVDISAVVNQMFDENGYRYDWFSRGMDAYATRFK